MLARSLVGSLVTALAAACVSVPTSAQAGALFGAARGAVAKRAIRPAPQQAAKQEAQQVAGKPRDVVIQRSKHPEAASHIEHAQKNGQPTVLHMDWPGAPDRGTAATGSVSLKHKPAPHFERDDYPSAMTKKGGHNANVRYINPHDNRGAGSSMRAQTHDLPDGSKIRVVVAD